MVSCFEQLIHAEANDISTIGGKTGYELIGLHSTATCGKSEMK
jgi:hypothetical protein